MDTFSEKAFITLTRKEFKDLVQNLDLVLGDIKSDSKFLLQAGRETLECIIQQMDRHLFLPGTPPPC